MGSELAKHYTAAREVFLLADRLLGFGLSDLCWEGPEKVLNDTYNTQPALYVCGVAALRALEEVAGNRLQLDYAAGHSLGEITALVCAGSLSFEDGLHLVRERGRLMKLAGETQPGGMVAVLMLGRDQVIEICANASVKTGMKVQLANDNCPGQVVISGQDQALEHAIDKAREAGAKRIVRLPVSIAAHSPLMASIVDEYRSVVDSTLFLSPQINVIANTTATPLVTPDAIRAELCDQLTSSVRWTETIEFLRRKGVTDFIEMGSGDVLTGLLRRIDRSANGHVVGTPEDVRKIVEM